MNKELRKFGFSLGLGLNILGFIMFLRHKENFIWFSVLGSFVLVSAILWSSILAPLKRLLDKLIFIIGWFTGTMSLLIVFYLIFTPISILFKIFGKDMLNEKIDKKTSSYWIKREKAEELSLKDYYERMG